MDGLPFAGLTAFPRSPGGTAAPFLPPSYGTAVDYLSANAAALSLSDNYSGGGWSPWFVVAFANDNTTLLGLPTGSTTCPVTWIEPQPTNGHLIFPPTSPSAAPGTSAGWGFIMSQASGSSLLFDVVVNGTATLILTLPTKCFNLPSNQAVPGGVINSTMAAAVADSVGGSSFLTQFSNANRTYELVSNSTNTFAPNLWGVVYSTPGCEDNQESTFQAIVNSLNGSVVATNNSTSGCTYPVDFSETGLANGTNWAVTINGSSRFAVAPSAVDSELLDGSYSYNISAPSGYRSIPSSGHFNVSGAAVHIAVDFALLPSNYTVTFTELGVPNGSALWGVGLKNSTGNFTFGVSNGGTSVSFAEQNGTYNYSISVQMGGWASLPPFGSVTVAGLNVTVSLAFVPGYNVTFLETGLPSGTPWSVNLNGSMFGNSGTEINFTEPNGTYPFMVNGPVGFAPAPATGSVVVNGTPVVQPIAFTLPGGFYTLTFTERGLPTGPGAPGWGVNLRNSTGGNVFEGSNGGMSVIFAEVNGTYNFSVSVGGGWVPMPEFGSITVSGGNVTELIDFVTGQTVTFTETGLPLGSFWSVTLNGTSFGNSGSEIYFSETNGIYPFVVNGPAGFTPSPATGNVVVNGTSVVQPIVFTLPGGFYTLTFTERGLPTGPGAPGWGVNLRNSTGGNVFGGSNGGMSVIFAEVNGTYNFSVSVGGGWVPTPEFGSITVSGGNVTELITFSPGQIVTFAETGLPSGTSWSVTLNGSTFGNSGPEINFTEPNGIYPFVVNGPVGFTPTPATGNVVVNGTPVVQPIAFTLPGGFYTLTFTERGLPTGPGAPGWGVNLRNSTGGSVFGGSNGGMSVIFAEVNGTYNFSVFVGGDWAATPQSGSIVISGANVTEPIAFERGYIVTFNETGLPPGTSWSVTLNGSMAGNSGSEINFTEPNGTYPFVANGSAGFTPTPSSGVIVVNGTPILQGIAFAPPSGFYFVSFTESGLPSGQTFMVTLGGDSRSLTTNGGMDTLVYLEPNGTYGYSIADISGWHQTTLPYGGSVVVNGSSVTEPTLAYTRVVYSATFSESGLPSGLTWRVTVSGSAETLTTNGAIESLSWFGLSNGTYGYSIADVSGWHQTTLAYVGSVVVNGSSVTEPTLAYARVVYSATFSESGLPSGLTWQVTVSGSSKSLTTNGATDSLTWFGLPNGTYGYSIADIPGWHQTTRAYVGTFVVNGSSVDEPTLAYSRMTYSLTFRESGLPSGTPWSVVLNGTLESTTGRSMVSAVPNGTYGYLVRGSSGFRILSMAPEGAVTVHGASVTRAATFGSGSTYTLTFHEVGLRAGTSWCVTMGSRICTATPNLVLQNLTPGIYSYSIHPFGGMTMKVTLGSTPVGSSGWVAVVHSETFQVRFTYSVTFRETGLPGGTSWSVSTVQLYGGTGVVTGSSQGTTIVFYFTNGTYAFGVGSVPGFVSVPGFGLLKVAGGPVVVSIHFVDPSPEGLATELAGGAGTIGAAEAVRVAWVG